MQASTHARSRLCFPALTVAREPLATRVQCKCRWKANQTLCMYQRLARGKFDLSLPCCDRKWKKCVNRCSTAKHCWKHETAHRLMSPQPLSMTAFVHEITTTPRRPDSRPASQQPAHEVAIKHRAFHMSACNSQAYIVQTQKS